MRSDRQRKAGFPERQTAMVASAEPSAVESCQRLAGTKGTIPPMTRTPGLTIEPLTPDRFPDVAKLFEEGGDPKWCWCAYFRVRGVDFSSGAKARHRSVLRTAADDGPALGRAPGLVAYDGDGPAGWISIGPR